VKTKKNLMQTRRFGLNKNKNFNSILIIYKFPLPHQRCAYVIALALIHTGRFGTV
jgi:hypothetical protein